MKNVFSKIKNKINSINNSFNKKVKEKPLKYVFQFLPNNIFLLVLFVTVVCTMIPKIINNDVKVSTTSYDGLREVILEPIEQKINIKKIDKIDKIGFLFATYKRKNTSIYELQIFEDDKLIESKKIDTRNLKDLKVKNFKIKPLTIDKNKEYKFVIKPFKDVRADNGITLATNSKDSSIYYELTKVSPFNNYIFIIAIIFLITFLIINYLINNEKIKNQNQFFIIMIAYLFSILIFYPSFQTPDEPYHFSKSYSLSQYDFSKNPYQNTKKKIKTPSNFKCLNYSNIQGIDNVTNYNKLKSCFKSKNNKFNKNLNKFGNDKILSYIPSAIGIKIADVFTNSPLIIFYVGRLSNFLVSLLIIYFSLKITPKHKNLLLAIVFIPMFIQQMISYSYDSILNSLCILIFAYLCKFYNLKDDTIKTKDLVIYACASLLIFNIKAPYILISCLIIFINKEKFEKRKFAKFISILLVILLPIILSKCFDYIGTIGTIASATKSTSHPSNLMYLIKNPLQIFVVAYNTITMRGIWYLITMIGSIGWLKYELDPYIIIIYYIFLILLTLSNSSNLNKNIKIKNIIILLVLLGGIELSMYIGWSSYKLNYVEGVQGRYFLPLLLPLMLQVMPKEKKIIISDEFVYSFINIIMYYFIIFVLVSFY